MEDLRWLFNASLALLVIGFVLQSRRARRTEPTSPVDLTIDWYVITFSEESIQLRVSPPERTAWEADIAWTNLERVVLEYGGFLEPDDLFLFVKGREASYRVPLAGVGGEALLNELVRRGLLPAEGVIALASKPEGGVLDSPK